ncbi:hypothetical protein Bca4012_027675 [Brassica carinata]
MSTIFTSKVQRDVHDIHFDRTGAGRKEENKRKHSNFSVTHPSKKAPKNSSKEKTMVPPSALAVPTTFDDLEGDFCNKKVLVRLIHCWEARNFKKGNIFMGVELFLIDQLYQY